MAETIAGTEYLTGDEAAVLLGVKKATLYAYVSRGIIRSYKQGVGRNRLYRRIDIEALRTIRTDDITQEQSLPCVELPDATSWVGDH